jgi:uncharacterized membrane protein YkoI
MIMKRYGYVAVGVMLSAWMFGGMFARPAYAADAGNDALALQKPTISLSQAVNAAEKFTRGRAIRAELETHDGRPVYDVEVVDGMKVMDVRVDKDNGRVLAATIDKADHDDAHDAED